MSSEEWQLPPPPQPHPEPLYPQPDFTMANMSMYFPLAVPGYLQPPPSSSILSNNTENERHQNEIKITNDQHKEKQRQKPPSTAIRPIDPRLKQLFTQNNDNVPQEPQIKPVKNSLKFLEQQIQQVMAQMEEPVLPQNSVPPALLQHVHKQSSHVLNEEPKYSYDQVLAAEDLNQQQQPLMKRRAKKSVNPEWQKRQQESTNFMPSMEQDGIQVDWEWHQPTEWVDLDQPSYYQHQMTNMQPMPASRWLSHDETRLMDIFLEPLH